MAFASLHRRRGRPMRRRGNATVELAIILPLFVMLVLGAIETGRAISVRHTLVESVRAGCRLHAVRGKDLKPAARKVIDTAMEEAGLRHYTVDFDPPATATLTDLTPVTVTLSVPYDRVCWGPNWIFRGTTLTARCTMPADVTD